MLEFRLDSRSVIRGLSRGVRYVLTYRGKPLAKLEPILASQVSDPDDPIFSLRKRAQPSPLGTLEHEQIDRMVYG